MTSVVALGGELVIANNDDAQLLAMGHKPILERNFSSLSLLGLAFAILNSWTALSVSMSLALPSGGPSSVIWGLVVAGICNVCLVLSLSEFLSAFPTAGGQYHWVAFVSPPSCSRFLSFLTGWINVGGWIALTATGGLLSSQLIVGIIALMYSNYEPQRWHQFLMYIGYSVLGFLLNAFATPLLPRMNKVSFMWSVSGFAVICIVVLATSSPNFADAKWVFGHFDNFTGWPNGIAWLLGLLQGSFGLTAYDAVAHMIEEIPNASVEGPKIMRASVYVGIFTGFIFLTVMMFVSGGAKNLDDLTSTTQTPLIYIFHVATKSRAAAVCLTMFPLLCLVFATTGFFTASSRMTFAFARDLGLPFSGRLSHVHSTLKLPLNALLLTLAVVVIFGCVFLGSSSAFNAITAASVIALNLTYGIPIAINCAQGRSRLPERAYTLSPFVGWLVNLVGLGYVLLTTVLFFFPPSLPATGNTVNYAIVAFALWLVVCLSYWFISGRETYKGPTIGGTMQPFHDTLDPTIAAADHTEFTIDADAKNKDEK